MAFKWGTPVNPNGKYSSGVTKDRVTIHWWNAPSAHATFAGVAHEMSNPGRAASVNIIAELVDGVVVCHQSVPFNKRAWTSGNRANDERSITIECEPFDVPPRAMIQGLAEMIASLVKAGHLSPAFTINGHKDVSATGCPGTYYPVLRQIAAAAKALLPSAAPHVLNVGSRGPEVAQVQRWLMRMFPATHGRIVRDHGGADGIYGKGTLQAVKSYQAACQREGVYRGELDGVWGPLTEAAAKGHGYRP